MNPRDNVSTFLPSYTVHIKSHPKLVIFSQTESKGFLGFLCISPFPDGMEKIQSPAYGRKEKPPRASVCYLRGV